MPSNESQPSSIEHILEALLFVGGGPLTAEHAAAAIRGLTSDQFTQALDQLNDEPDLAFLYALAGEA